MPSSLSLEATNILGWTLVAVGIVLTGVRYYLRIFALRKVYWDDLLHGFALLLFIGELVCFRFYMSSIYYVNDESNLEPLDEKYRVFQGRDLTMTLLSFTCFWAIKFTFLMFYWSLFMRWKGFVRRWWITAILTFITYWAAIGGTLAECGGVAADFLRYSACITPSATYYQKQRFIFNYVMNIATDLAIMALPISCIRRLQLSKRRKIGLGVLFGFGLIIMFFESLRLAKSIVGVGSSNNALWLFLESAACIYVSCFTTFPALRKVKKDRTRSGSIGQSLQRDANRNKSEGGGAMSIHSSVQVPQKAQIKIDSIAVAHVTSFV